ncbi:GHKL domain-containing protein [Ruminococcus sp.]|uniref:sensor histidine kinase n=1 Tax=Ruminococcus sp. TaxID=41978 RepID=UPI0025CF5535|nr:GHKL domain-containing protein [Ruminococcus sp.]MBQ8966441.1 sensor histidine kinase [Ruminococcus sp.]
MDNELMKLGGYIASNVVYYLLLNMFLIKVSLSRRFGRWQTYGITAAILIISVAVNVVGIPIFNLLTHLGGVVLLTLWVYKNEFKKGLLYTVCFMAAAVISELLASALWTVITGKSTMEELTDPQINFIHTLISCVMYLSAMTAFNRKEQLVVRAGELVMFVFMSVLEIFVSIEYAAGVVSRGEGAKLIAILVGFLALDVYFIITMRRIADSYQARYDNGLLHKQIEIQLAHYQELEKNYAEGRKVIHDIKKHLAILSELKSEEPDKASQYRRMIEADVDSLGGGFTCSNRILAIVMGQKIAAAEAQGIDIGTDVEDIEFSFMNDLDITAIFANLWDNAIEACESVTNKWIKVSAEQRGGFILITFRNSYDGKLIRNGRKFRSTKSGHSGVGLTIIRSTVEKYGGLLNLEAGQAEFAAEITLPLPMEN